MKCVECGSTGVETRRENHRYRSCGLDNVTLVGIQVNHCRECGQNEYVIPHIEQLHSALAHVIATKSEQLVPQEIRFLRKYLGFSSADFANALAVRPETISRWEKSDSIRPMNKGLERLLRLMVLNERPAMRFAPKQVAGLATEHAVATRVRIARKNDGWEAQEVRAA
jgi:putative zinc finger/helix-turn-helix YgiT family protein